MLYSKRLIGPTVIVGPLNTLIGTVPAGKTWVFMCVYLRALTSIALTPIFSNNAAGLAVNNVWGLPVIPGNGTVTDKESRVVFSSGEQVWLTFVQPTANGVVVVSGYELDAT